MTDLQGAANLAAGTSGLALQGALQALASQSATYEPLAQSLFIPAVMFTPTTGTPAITANNRRIYMAFDPTTAEVAAATVWTPASWLTYDVQVLWTQVTGGAGVGTTAVAWRVDVGNDIISGASNTQPASAPGSVNAVVAAQYIVSTTTVRSSLPNDATKGTTVVVLRTASDVGDNYGNDAMLIGVRLLKIT